MPEKVCLITGAGRGIGQAAAFELDKLGWSLALVSRTESELKETAAKCRKAICLPSDVTKSEQVNGAVAAAIAEFGQVDAAVNCAGVAPLVPIVDTTDEVFRMTIETNLTHSFYVTRALWPHFVARKSGCIVNISSIAGRDPYDGFGAYGAAKAAIDKFSLVASREGAKHGIRVHVVAPGATETKMLREVFPVEKVPREAALPASALGKVIAQVVAGDLYCTSGEIIYVHR